MKNVFKHIRPKKLLATIIIVINSKLDLAHKCFFDSIISVIKILGLVVVPVVYLFMKHNQQWHTFKMNLFCVMGRGGQSNETNIFRVKLSILFCWLTLLMSTVKFIVFKPDKLILQRCISFLNKCVSEYLHTRFIIFSYKNFIYDLWTLHVLPDNISQMISSRRFQFIKMSSKYLLQIHRERYWFYYWHVILSLDCSHLVSTTKQKLRVTLIHTDWIDYSFPQSFKISRLIP